MVRKVYLETIGCVNTPDNFWSRVTKTNPLHYPALEEPSGITSYLCSPNRNIWAITLRTDNSIADMWFIYSDVDGKKEDREHNPISLRNGDGEIKQYRIGDIFPEAAEDEKKKLDGYDPSLALFFQERLNDCVQLFLSGKATKQELAKSYKDLENLDFTTGG